MMSLLGHVVLTLLFEGLHYLVNRSYRVREGAVHLEEGVSLPVDEQDMSVVDVEEGESNDVWSEMERSLTQKLLRAAGKAGDALAGQHVQDASHGLSCSTIKH